MKNNYFGVIMAGGVGSRFWPLSTTEYPKQFHDILGTGRTFLQSTFDRLKKIIPVEQIYVVTLEEYADLTLQQLPEISENQVIAEPSGMNTAPCNLYAAQLIHEINPEANIVVAPSDHVILNEDIFVKKLEIALKESEEMESLITLGIQPTRPDTGYGYIQFIENSKSEIKKVKTFTEKPGIELAEVLYKSGDFLWNAGIFVWKAKTILNAFQQHLPEMFESFQKIKHPLNSPEGKEKIKLIYSTVQMISIDNGILEKADNVFVIPSSFGWSDLGTWKSLFENSEKNDESNVKNGKHILTYNTKDSLIYTSQNKAIIVDGLEDYIVVNTRRALLICPMDKDQAIKAFVSDLKLNKGEKFV
ncbi:MAG: mannose-1-phosphate guanylyltransferase [Flavobacteriaceae bacterium]|jgi:mannose-1-phosphate guanylyltransferase|nr:mannose-1-phosphate guanylyltransferase [Flavobacteriaceae bacterium]